MDSIVYNALMSYFNALEKLGYISDSQVEKLLILCFYRDFVYKDFNSILSESDYRYIERALDCLYGSTCLIPYPNYLKMGKLRLGEITELAQRVKNIEDTEVLKSFDGVSEDSDVIVISNDEED